MKHLRGLPIRQISIDCCGFLDDPPQLKGVVLNKEQIKHWADVLKDVATGQFLFFGGKNLYLYSKSYDFDWVILMMSGVIYLVFHGIIHLILSELED